MTEREIIDAGIDYTMEHNPICVGGDAMGDMREFNRSFDFEAGAKWAKERMIDKVCEWLDENACFENAHGQWTFNTDELRKTMEEEK